MINTWTREQIEILCRDYSTTPNEVLAEALDRPRQQVTNKARDLGLKKTPDYIESVRARSGGARWQHG